MKRLLIRLSLPALAALFTAAPGNSQDQLTILAVKKGRFGLIRTPASELLSVGDDFFATRDIDGRRVRTARVRVVLVEKKYSGVKVIETLIEPPLLKNDRLVREESSRAAANQFADKIKSLEAHGVPAVDNQSQAPPAGELDQAFANKKVQPAARPDSVRPIPASEWEAQHPSGRSTAPAGRDGGSTWPADLGQGSELSLINRARTLLGPTFAVFAPVSSTADAYAPGPQAGFQMITPFRGRTLLRISAGVALPEASTTILQQHQNQGFWQNSRVGFLTATLMPHMQEHVFFDIGPGFFRQYDEQMINGYLYTSSANAAGVTAGIGWRSQFGEVHHILVLASGNIYFPRGGNSPFLNLVASYLFGL